LAIRDGKKHEKIFIRRLHRWAQMEPGIAKSSKMRNADFGMRNWRRRLKAEGGIGAEG
jgi:hypothetical protein